MRILKEIPHPKMRISVFGMNQKYLIKFELGAFEQTYKISETDVLSIDHLEKFLEESFLEQVMNRFQAMKTDWSLMHQKHGI